VLKGAPVKKEDIRTEQDVNQALSDWTDFERSVLVATFKIPKGKVSTYKRIAEKIGRPNAYRAVGNALHKNPLDPVVPCHRVVASDGSFSGPKEGAESRRSRLKAEGVSLNKGRVKISLDILY